MTRIAVIGGGWAGLAAAVEAVSLGAAVTLFEMAPTLGGRARSLEGSEPALDNGQHILIGAYTASLALMRRVGADPEADLLRMPLRLRYPDRDTLTLPGGLLVADRLRLPEDDAPGRLDQRRERLPDRPVVLGGVLGVVRRHDLHDRVVDAQLSHRRA